MTSVKSDQAPIRLLLEEIRRLANLLKACPPENHRASVLAIFQQLSLAPQTVPQLARGRSTSRQNVQLMVNRWIASGYLRLQPNPAHKRSDLLELTESGANLLAAMSDRDQRFMQELASQISDADCALTLATLRRLRCFLSERNQPITSSEQRPTRATKTLKPSAPPAAERKPLAPSGTEESQPQAEDLPVFLL